MYEFKYHRPATVRQAANLLVKNEDAKVIAGGHTLLPVMKQRLANPPHLVDLSHIEGLDSIEMKGRSLVIGATAKHADVAASAIVGETIPALAELAGMIGDPAVRHKGTIGGSLANNDPTADYPAACLALGATIVTNKRRLKPEEFFQGLFTTALENDEIITRVMFPVPKKAAYVKFRNQASRYALVGVFVAKRPSDVRVAVTGAGSEGVFRVISFEEALNLKTPSQPDQYGWYDIPAPGKTDPIKQMPYKSQTELFAETISNAFEGAGQELLNATVLGAAVLMLMWHNAWMARHGREMAAEMQPGSLLPQRRQLGREDPCARVEERPPLQPAGAVRNLAGKEGVRPGIERWQRIRILVRARGEGKRGMTSEPDRVEDESA